MANEKTNKFAQIVYKGIEATLQHMLEAINDPSMAAEYVFRAFLEEEASLSPRQREETSRAVIALTTKYCFDGNRDKARATLNRLDQSRQVRTIAEGHHAQATAKQAAPAKRPQADNTPAMTYEQMLDQTMNGFVAGKGNPWNSAGVILGLMRRTSLEGGKKTHILKIVRDRLVEDAIAPLSADSSEEDKNGEIAAVDNWIDTRLDPNFVPVKHRGPRSKKTSDMATGENTGSADASPSDQPRTLN